MTYRGTAVAGSGVDTARQWENYPSGFEGTAVNGVSCHGNYQVKPTLLSQFTTQCPQFNLHVIFKFFLYPGAPFVEEATSSSSIPKIHSMTLDHVELSPSALLRPKRQSWHQR